MPWHPSRNDAPFKPDKGQRNGSCNRRACQDPGAVYYNRGSMSWYCESCARDLNSANFHSWRQSGSFDGRPMCIRVEPDDRGQLHAMPQVREISRDPR